MICLTYLIPVATASIVVLLTYVIKKLGIVNRFIYKVDPKCTRHGGELVADVLKAHGVKFVFTLVGGHISPILTACEKRDIRVVDVRHEATAVFAADAVARMSGTIGVAAVTAGPGLTNTVTAVKNAQMAESPLLLIGGAAAGLSKGRGALQDIDQMSLFQPLCKYCATVTTVRDIIPIVKKAIQIAQSGTPGPVFVEFPVDTLYPYQIVRREIGLSDKPGSLRQKLVNWYLSNYLFQLYAGGFDLLRTPGQSGAIQNSTYLEMLTPLPVDIPLASSSEIHAAAAILRRAKRPLILFGSQATLPPISPDDVSDAVKKMRIPTFLGGMARGLLGRNCDLQIRQRRREALQQADVILLAGTVCDFRLGYGRALSKKAKIIAINRDHSQLFKNSGVFWAASLAIQADAGDAIKRIAETLQGWNPPEEWRKSLAQADVEQEAKNYEKTLVPAAVHLNPLHVLNSLENDGLSDNAVLVADGGDFVGSAAYILRPRGPLTWLDPGAFGTLGVGGGFALGAKLCRPESDVWIIYGDGSLGYSVAEFDTFNRHKIPVIALVGNDACWSQIAREQIPQFGSGVACMLDYTSYEVVADGYGGRGFLLNCDNVSEMKQLFLKARQITEQENKPVLINCLIGKSDFREGSISV